MLVVAADWRPGTPLRLIARLMADPQLARYVSDWPPRRRSRPHRTHGRNDKPRRGVVRLLTDDERLGFQTARHDRDSLTMVLRLPQ